MTRSRSTGSAVVRPVIVLVVSAIMVGVLVLVPASATVDHAAGPAGDSWARHDSSAGPERLPRIHGTVGPGFRIKVDDDEVPAGRYRFRVRDRSKAHNFHLLGEGVDRATTVPEVVRQTWRVELREGTYVIQCDPHLVAMRVELNVTAQTG